MKQYRYESAVRLGQMANLLQGMTPGAKNLFSVCKEEESVKEVSGWHTDAYWGPFPVLNRCDTVEKLAEALFDGFCVKGRNKEFAAGAVLKAGDALTREKVQNFAAFCGLEKEWLDSEKYSYVLVQVPRVMEDDTEELTGENEWNLQKSLNISIKVLSDKLEKDELGNLLENGENVRTILSKLQDSIGTHYVRKIQKGDSALQVFVYDKETYAQICHSMDINGWKREKAFGFRYFTSGLFVKEAGKVVLKSQSKQTEKLRAYLADAIYGRTESVFSLLLNEEASKFADTIDEVTCVGAELIPVYESCESGTYIGKLVCDTTVQAGVARFGAVYAGPFSCQSESQVDYGKLYRDFDRTDKMTLLWTPMMSVSQMYICLDDILAMKAVNRTVLKHLLLCADIVEIKGNLELSYLDSFTIVCRKLICHTQEEGCSVCLSSKAFESLKVYCAQVDGSCQFVLPGGQVPEGLLYHQCGAFLINENTQVNLRCAFSGNTPAEELARDDIKESYEQWIQNGIHTGLQTMLTSSSIPLMANKQSGKGSRTLEKETWHCMEWVCQCYAEAILKADAEEVKRDMSVFYGNAMAVLRRSVNPFEEGTVQPHQISLLTYEAYEKPINRILDLCVEYENELQHIKDEIRNYNAELEKHYEEARLRENLKEMAEFMNRQNEAMQQYQADINSQELTIYQSKNTELLSLQNKSTELDKRIKKYKDDLQKKVEELNDAIEKKKVEEKIKAAFTFAESLCTIVGNIGQSYCNWSDISAASQAEKTLKKWEAFLNSMKAIESITKFGIDLDGTISKLSKWEAEHPGFEDYPTAMEWEICMHDCIAQIAPLEADFSAQTAAYRSALENIVSCAQQKDEYQSQISRLQTEMSQHKAQASTAKKQEDRLKELSVHITSADWQPQEDALADMGQCAAVLAQKEDAMLLKLVTLMQLQSGSMEYQYCGIWEPITSFTLKAIRENLVNQSLAAIQGMQSFLTVPTELKVPLIYETKVSVDVLTGEEGCEIEVPMDMGLWRNLSHVRINAMDIRLSDIRTDSGRCHVKLVTSGNSMKDRGIGNAKSSYVMPSRDWFVVYDISSNETIMYTEPAKDWGKYFTKPTPFQKIWISLAKTPENEGFSAENDKVHIKIWFYLEACYSENTGKEQLLKRLCISKDKKVPEFINQLSGHTITGGWDVINFLSVKAINDLWEVRWKKETDKEYRGEDYQFLQKIDVSSSRQLPGGLTYEFRLEADLGAPRLHFQQEGIRRVEVTIPIIKGKLNEKTIKGGEVIGQEETEIDVSEKKHPSIRFALDINKLEGSTETTGKVYLTPEPDAVVLENIKIEGEVEVSICEKLVSYIKEKKLQPWYLGEVKYPCDVSFLKPKDFYFQTFLPEEEFKNVYPGILGIYILTKTKTLPCTQIEKTWPKGTWPVSESLDAAVYFSEDILWNDEIKGSIETQLKEKGYGCEVNDKDGYKIKVTGTKDIPVMTQTFEVGYISSMGTVNIHDQKEEIRLHFPIDGAVITTSCEGISIDYEGSWKEKLPYVAQYPTKYGTSFEVRKKEVTFTCKFHGVSKATVDKEGKLISFSSFQTSPTVTADQPSLAFYQLNFEKVQECIIKSSKDALINEIGKLNLQLHSMPVFAVSNLLFPQEQTMTPSGVYIPRDLVLTGSVVKES